MNTSLFNYSVRIREHIKRNVVMIPQRKDIYADLLDDVNLQTVEKASARAAMIINGSTDNQSFFYKTAIEYPFKSEPFMISRYSDGTFPVWYGSKSIETTIFETVYHVKQQIMAIADYQEEGKIIKKRNVFDVFCDAVLTDVVSNKDHYEYLTSDDYTFCNQLGKELHERDCGGLLSPSARHKEGVNVDIFKQALLSEVTLVKELKYTFDVQTHEVSVFEDPKHHIMVI